MLSLTEAWYRELVARWGEPRLDFDTMKPADGKQPRMLESDHGRHHRRGAAWFPVMGGKPVNHNFHIDTYGNGRINIVAASHAMAGNVWKVSFWADITSQSKIDELCLQAIHIAFRRSADHECF